jgi:dihydropteroate synthase
MLLFYLCGDAKMQLFMDSKDTPFAKIRKLRTRKKLLDFSVPKIMGILNLTPDSFYDGGKYTREETWIRQTRKMLDEGADIIDIGAVSTRPGAREVSVAEETERLLPAVKKLVKTFPDTIFSIDTYRAEIAEKCLDAGADIINDISGGTMDSRMFRVIARRQVPYVLMHIHGTPENMQQHPLSENVLEKVQSFFKEKVNILQDTGVESIILDPGFGFGKTLEANYQLLAGLNSLRVDNLPIMAGVSRKSMVNKVLGTMPDEALNGTTVLHTLALLNGANLLRVHDVKPACEAVEIVKFYRTFGKSTG